MRRHHETTAAAIVSALSMVLPVAGGLWVRLVALKRQAASSAKNPSEAGHATHE